MKSISIYTTLIAAAAALSVLFLSGGANAVPIAVIEDVTPSITEPAFTDMITITTTLVIVDAEVSEGDVVLIWFPCTELMCDSPEFLNMTKAADDSWTITIGPFEENSITGDRYEKITISVEVQAHATDGSDDPEVQRSAARNIYFNTGEPHNDDSPHDDDGPADENGDSPLGPGVLIAGVLIMTALIIRVRSRY